MKPACRPMTPADPADLWSDGYVLTPRRLFPKGWIADEPVSEREATLDLWFLANHDDRNGLSRGQCDPSLSFLSERWGWDKSRVRRFLKRLESEGVVTRHKGRGRKRIVTTLRAYDPPRKSDTLATPKKPTSKAASGGVRDTSPDTNRTKSSRSAKSKRVGRRTDELRPCPTCGLAGIAVDVSECLGCRQRSETEAEIDAWTPEEMIQC